MSIVTPLVIGIFAAVMVIPSVMTVSMASIENNSNVSSNGFNIPSGSSTHFPIPPDNFNAGLEHINQAQAALQDGDIEGAQNHLELAKESFQRYCDACVKPVNPDIVQ